ncbi:MAG: metallophosphoesterase, partial [Ruminococcus sp.]|nr:metallophosphoesterase [Ruminococcus sp.]
LNSDTNFTIVATGGTYTFTFNTETKELTVEHTSFEEKENDLINRADRTDPYLYVSKEEFKLNESIYVTAQGGCWVGIYPASQETYDNTYSYYYYTEGNRPSAVDKTINAEVPDGEAVDIRTLYLQNNDKKIDPTRTIGSYKAVLFGTSNYSQVLKEVYFDVVPSNSYEYNELNYISTDKESYYYGEPIMVSAYTTRPDLSPWVAVVEHGTTPKSGNLKYWYYLPIDGEGDNAEVSSSPQNIFDVSKINNGVYLSEGKYDVYLYRTNSYNYPRGYVTIEVLSGSGAIDTNKDVYGVGEDITVTVTDTGVLRDSWGWVGIYNVANIRNPLPTMPTDGLGLKSWYYVYVQDSYAQTVQNIDPKKGVTESITSTGDVFSAAEAVPGEYVAVLFSDSDYNPIAMKTFTITDDVLAGVKGGEYKLDNLTDGFANGRVALELDDSALPYLGDDSLEVAVYWAGSDQQPLADYKAFAKHKVSKSVNAFDTYPYTFIPNEATGMVAYAYYNGKEGSEGYYFELPLGCKTYTDIDSGVLSEFQIVSDIHITSDNVTHYSDGSQKLANVQSETYSHSNFNAMLSDIALNSKNSSGIFVVGDVTNNGFAEEYAEFTSLYNTAKATSGNLPAVYVTLGNHDSYADATIAPYVNFANSLGADITADAPYYSKEINGYTYIFLAGDNSDYYGRNSNINPNRINSTDAELSKEQLEWLDAQLKANEEKNPDKPVFVMLHQAMANTVAGSLT